MKRYIVGITALCLVAMGIASGPPPIAVLAAQEKPHPQQDLGTGPLAPGPPSCPDGEVPYGTLNAWGAFNPGWTCVPLNPLSPSPFAPGGPDRGLATEFCTQFYYMLGGNFEICMASFGFPVEDQNENP